MQKRNVTLSVPRDLLRQAKAVAASQEKSLSELLRESLREKVMEATGYREAMERQLGLLESGLSLGLRDRVTVTRDELHDRR